VWLVEQPVPETPSPKVQAQVNVPVPPVGLATKLTAIPTSVGFGDAVGAATVGAAFTVTATLFEAFPPTASVAVTLAVNGDPVVVV
jgi:hypothetical protein